MTSAEILKEYRIFKGLTAEDLKPLLSFCEEISFNATTNILKESTDRPDSDLYLIEEGTITAEVKSNLIYQGRVPRCLAILQKGDSFGEIGLLHGKTPSAKVTASRPTKTLKLSGEKLMEYLDDNPGIGYQVMKNLASILALRLTDLVFRWKDDI